MKIVQINSVNLHYLHTFCGNIMPPQFRYFNTRKPVDAVSNHVITLIGLINDTPIAYGHIDYSKDENKDWLGICLLEGYQGKGYGKQIMNKLIDTFNNTDIDTLYLTVDKDNTIAISMYKKYSFNIIDEEESYYIMCLNKIE